MLGIVKASLEILGIVLGKKVVLLRSALKFFLKCFKIALKVITPEIGKRH